MQEVDRNDEEKKKSLCFIRPFWAAEKKKKEKKIIFSRGAETHKDPTHKQPKKMPAQAAMQAKEPPKWKPALLRKMGGGAVGKRVKGGVSLSRCGRMTNEERERGKEM